VAEAKKSIYDKLDAKQREFVEFVLTKYIESGVGELDQEKLPDLLQLKYHALPDAIEIFGSTEKILSTFIDFQRHLYQRPAA
jgi:type I restriction enzyme R subunit